MSFLTTLPRHRYSPEAFAGFKPEQATFNLGTARAMAWACQFAYETAEPEKVRSIAADWSLTIPDGGIVAVKSATILPISSTELVVGIRNGVAIVTIAGTDPLTLPDWITDFTFLPTSAGSAHGFTEAAAGAWPAIERLLNNDAAALPVFVTGHSLGGALAALIAQRIHSAQPGRVRAVYTFGMPRTGNALFQTQYDQSLGTITYRLVHGDDVVPTVPPSGVGARHVGRFLRCGKLGKFDSSTLATAAGSDEPRFIDGLLAQIRTMHLGALSGNVSIGARFKLATALMLGVGPFGMRTDPGGIAIELLPPPVRDHMPDRYIAAT
jgi:triacylglycerol lipase